jgi:hypothetical protein
MRSAIIIVIAALSVIAVSLIVQFDVFAVRSNPCPKYCDGCCIPRPRNSTTSALVGGGEGSIVPPGGNNVPNIRGPINSSTTQSFHANISGRLG